MNIANLSIRQPVLITMLVLALVVVGLIGYSRMPVDLFPDISVPIVVVTTVYPGASPAEIQREIAKPLEETLGSLNGVKKVRSTSSENMSQVIVEYNLDYSAIRGAEDVRERVAAVRGTFPSDARDPIIQRFDMAMLPVLSFGIADQTNQLPPDELRRLAVDQIKPRLERLDGVANVEVIGGLVREIQVDLDLDAMRTRRIAPQQVVSAIQMENMTIPGGRMTDQGRDVLLRTPGDFQKADDLNRVTVSNLQGMPVYLRDIATVRDGFAEVQTHSRLDGADSIVLSVRKQSGTNTVRVAEAVKAEMARVQSDFPNLSVALGIDQADFIERSTEDAILDLILGGVFASLVVLLFFRDLRNTLVTVAGLPVIMIGTFAVLNALGLTLNMVTLLALALAVGLVIDDAIVVRENIFRHMERGETPKEASGRGTNEVALAVVAMTLTVVSVFLPIAFTTGLVGKFLREFGLAVTVAVLISLFEAFTLAPMLSAYLFKRRVPKPVVHPQPTLTTIAPRKGLDWGDLSPSPATSSEAELGHEGDEHAAARLGWLDRGYRGVLAWALRHKLMTVLGGVATFLIIVGLVATSPMAFMPIIDMGFFEVNLTLPAGTPLAQTDAEARRVEEALKALPGVGSVFTTVGGEGTPEKASFLVRMRETGFLQRGEAGIRQSLADVPGVTFTFDMAGGGGSQQAASFGRPIQLNLRTTGSYEELDQVSQDIMAAIRNVPGLVDLDRSFQSGKPELRIEVDRDRAQRAGLSTAVVGSTIRTLINGDVASRFRESGREADIVVRLREQDRSRLDEILALPIPSPTGQLVPLRSVATVAMGAGPASIERVNRQPQIVVGGNYFGRTQPMVMDDVRSRLARMTLPPGVTVEFGGETEQMEESLSTLLFALMLSIIFIYMVLASQFRSFAQPLVLMLALPLSVLGAFLALLIARVPFDMMVMISMFLLTGLVTKNSILLVDFTNRLREQGHACEEALLIAGPVRLRPILMTTLSLILGMTPVALGIGAAGSFRALMAIAVIGGLITSTLLTLVLVPVAYSLLDALMSKVKRAPAVETAPAPAAE